MSALSILLTEMFPSTTKFSEWNVEGLLKGLDTNLEREMKDGSIPSKWSDSELQWDPICTDLYEHANQTGSESLAWVLLLLVADRCHGLWRVPRNGRRHNALIEMDNWNRAMFAMRARLGVVDGWLRRNDSKPYSQHVFQAFRNRAVCTLSPKTELWNNTLMDRRPFNERMLDALQSPLNIDHFLLLEDSIGCSVFGDDGVQKIQQIESIIQGLPKKQRKLWTDIDPIAVRSLVVPMQQDVQMAQIINAAWKNIQLED
jgi:hypothetical protein